MEIIKKEKHLTINLEYFNTSFLYLDIDSYFKSNEQFINIIYKSPTVYLEGIMLEMPWMRFNKSSYTETNEIGEEITKKFIEFNFNEDNSDNKIYVFGCNGSGVALMPYLGYQAANMLTTNQNSSLAISKIKNEKNYFKYIIAKLLPFLGLYYRFRENLENKFL